MTEEFNLSELENDCVKGFMTKDVKEFIKKLKEEMFKIKKDCFLSTKDLYNIINKLAGDELK